MTLNGWGNTTPALCRVLRPERGRDLRAIVALDGDNRGLIARGLGRSYGDSALNDGGRVVLDQKLDRLIGFDPEAGVLECEAGVSLGELIDVFLPRGFFPSVVPGTKFVTVGGAIAADIHGKNHHVDGTFGNFVESIELLTGTGEILTCSREQNADAFWATVGGMGLTGLILSARLRLRRVESAYLHVDYHKARNLDHALELFGQGDREFRYSVAWIDCLAKGEALGRSVLMRGDHAPADDLPGPLRASPLTIRPKRKKSIPFNFPGFVLNPLSIKAFNALYYSRHKDGRKLVDFDTYFFPLDGIFHWNRMYGRRGFIQYQALFPTSTAREGMIELLEAIAKSRMASFLAVLKTTGPANEGLLSFPKPGLTLALDLPNSGRKLRELVGRLDEILLKHDGRLYLAKDATMSRETFERMYDRAGEFRRIKMCLDTRGRFASTQARRLGLVEGS
jgi:FAD/FMN-containing dehydrogenase